MEHFILNAKISNLKSDTWCIHEHPLNTPLLQNTGKQWEQVLELRNWILFVHNGSLI